MNHSDREYLKPQPRRDGGKNPRPVDDSKFPFEDRMPAIDELADTAGVPLNKQEN